MRISIPPISKRWFREIKTRWKTKTKTYLRHFISFRWVLGINSTISFVNHISEGSENLADKFESWDFGGMLKFLRISFPSSQVALGKKLNIIFWELKWCKKCKQTIWSNFRFNFTWERFCFQEVWSGILILVLGLCSGMLGWFGSGLWSGNTGGVSAFQFGAGMVWCFGVEYLGLILEFLGGLLEMPYLL